MLLMTSEYLQEYKSLPNESIVFEMKNAFESNNFYETNIDYIWDGTVLIR